jgi:hypothetical protein
MMPAYRALVHLDPRRCDLLLLRDPTRTHYARGVAGLAADLPALARFVESFARRGGYADVATFGTSAGALPAVGVALASGFARALAVAPESLAEHPAVERVLDELPPERRNGGTEVVVVHAELHEVDAARADELERRLPRVRRVRVSGSDRHNALSVLHERSALRELLARHLEARP